MLSCVCQIKNLLRCDPRPGQPFRLRIPPLTGEQAKIIDEVPSPDTLLLTLSDDLCREFIVWERPGLLGDQSIEAWVAENIVEPLTRSRFKLQEPKTLKTRFGTVVALLYRAAGGAPCVATAGKASENIPPKADAEVGWYVFHHSGSFYRLIYVLGVGPNMKESWLVRRAPVETVLAQFAEGSSSSAMQISHKLGSANLKRRAACPRDLVRRRTFLKG